MKVKLENLTKRFPNRNKKLPDVIAVNDFTFEIPDGKLIGLLGPSGCGKSTTLNLLSGLLTPTSGRIFFGDDDVTNLPAEARGVGLVFQNYALYPHLTVRRNITFPLENLRGNQKLTREQMDAKALEVARLVQIDALMDRKPAELSGGQQQRVAIARALVNSPRILLADEPTGNLDNNNAWEIMKLLEMINSRGTTVVVVTHNMEIVREMGKRVITIRKGSVVSDSLTDEIGGDDYED